MTDRDDCHRHDGRGQREQFPELGTVRRRDRRKRAAEADRSRGQQQILHGREDRRADRDLETAFDIGAHDDVYRRSCDATGRALVDIGEHLRGEPRLGEGAAVLFPGLAGELADRSPGHGVADDHELPGLAVFCAGRVGCGFEERAELGVGDRRVGELPACPLAIDDGEQVAVGFVTHEATRSPTRANEFTYMMRRLGPFAQCRK